MPCLGRVLFLKITLAILSELVQPPPQQNGGLNEYTIKILGRWYSSAYERYIQTPRENLAGTISSSGSKL